MSPTPRLCSDGIERRFCPKCNVVLLDSEAEYCGVSYCVEARGEASIPTLASHTPLPLELVYDRDLGWVIRKAKDSSPFLALNLYDQQNQPAYPRLALADRIADLEGALTDLLAVVDYQVSTGMVSEHRKDASMNARAALKGVGK